LLSLFFDVFLTNHIKQQKIGALSNLLCKNDVL